VVKWTLSELEKLDPDDDRFDPKVKVLMESVRRHVQEEEGDLFPKARKLLGQEMLDELGSRMEKAKKLAPTRPHPRAPDMPPGNLVAGIAAAMMDRGKDLMRDLMTRGRQEVTRRGGELMKRGREVTRGPEEHART
jgi:hypothetical protein